MDSDFDRTLQHAIRGHENAQSVIRFFDEKNAFVVGLSTAVAGVGGLVLDKVLGAPTDGPLAAISAVCIGHILALLAILASFVLCATCIICAVFSVRASCPPPNRSVEHSVLFPYHACEKAWDARENYLKALRGGMADALVLCEYADQLAILGGIIFEKRKHHQRSVLLFAWQVGTLVAGIALGLITTKWS